ncbi:MAG TPA: hypothetical protein PKI78_00595 [Anaerolineales bacterium]|nr:hypothetical protein [Anaerolineales bacterium]
MTTYVDICFRRYVAEKIDTSMAEEQAMRLTVSMLLVQGDWATIVGIVVTQIQNLPKRLAEN